MPAAVLIHHVVGDLTVGKPEISELLESDSLEAAAKAIAESAEGAVPVWQPKAAPGDPPSGARFVGFVGAVDIVAFLAAAAAGGGVADGVMAATPVADVMERNVGLLREVDPEMMKQGVRCLLVRKSLAWTGVSKRFSILYYGKWLKSLESASASGSNVAQPSSASTSNKFCCLTREDVIRFLIGCLGALAPIPLSSMSSLGAINPYYCHTETTMPAIEALQKIPRDPCAIAVVETNLDGSQKILGEISAYKFQKCDYLAVAWVIANMSAGQFVSGGDENGSTQLSLPEPPLITSLVEEAATSSPAAKPKKFSSRSIGFFSSSANQMAFGRTRSMYHRSRSAPLTCRSTSSLAAVMAQMLSHRATHVWVTESNSEDGILVGVIGYTDILTAVTKGNAVPSS